MNQPDFPQDPDELFDVVTEDGVPTGIVKRRADVHRDGDWHRAIHVWVYGSDADGAFVLFNLRSRNKDTMPLRLDVTVGGHLGAGETVADAFREIEEEIGITVNEADLEFLFVRRALGETERELQDVYLVRIDRALADYRPNPAELEALVRITLPDVLKVCGNPQTSVSASALQAESGLIEPFQVDDRTLLPPRFLPYHLEIARAIAARLGFVATPGA